ncbi:MAG: hypothetical protein AB8H03_09290 [Saprospiraceae bacterium]
MKKIFLSINYLTFLLLVLLSNFVNAQNNNISADSTSIKVQQNQLDSLKSFFGNDLDSNTISNITQINLSELAPDPDQFNLEEKDSNDFKSVPFVTPTDNYKEAIQKAKKSNKPILIYFTGYGSVNAMKMDHYILYDLSIQKFCLKNMEVITLYVDERKKLNEPIELDDSIYEKKRVLKNIGQQNAYFQLKKFKSNTQPSFYIIDKNEQILISYGYSTVLNDFKDFLKTGKDLYYK